jgi:hypothetical protein
MFSTSLLETEWNFKVGKGFLKLWVNKCLAIMSFLSFLLLLFLLISSVIERKWLLKASAMTC